MLSREILEKLTNKQLIDAYIGLQHKYMLLAATHDELSYKHSLVQRAYTSLVEEDWCKRNSTTVGCSNCGSLSIRCGCD